MSASLDRDSDSESSRDHNLKVQKSTQRPHSVSPNLSVKSPNKTSEDAPSSSRKVTSANVLRHNSAIKKSTSSAVSSSANNNKSTTTDCRLNTISGAASKLLLVSSKCKHAAVLEKSTNSDVIAVLYNYDNITYDSLLSLICASFASEQKKVTSVAYMVTCQQGSMMLMHSGNNDGILSSETLFTQKHGPGKFFKMLFRFFVDTTFAQCRLDMIATGCKQEFIATRLQNFLGVPVSISKELLGYDTIFCEYTDSKTNGIDRKVTVAEAYFQPDKLRSWSTGSYQTIDLFEKIRMVGKGAFGTAVLYRKKDDNSLVVLKEINMTELNSQERLMAMNETRVLAMLNHPNIICYYDTFEENGVLMIEMEYADDGTLSQFLTKLDCQLDEQAILTMFGQVVAGIAYMHEQKVLHRDLKTANIFMTKDGFLKIGDFGVSKVMTSKLRAANTVIGTPYYISPEMCEGKSYDEKSDIWALGCILYEMASRQRTFEGTNLPALVHKIMNGQIARIRGDYSTDFRRLVKDMLAKDPDQRPTAGELESTRLPELLARYGILDDRAQVFHPTAPRPDHRKCDGETRSVLYLYNTALMRLEPVDGFPATIKIRQVAVGHKHVVAVAMERTVYTWGENEHGQLGQGHQKPLARPTPVEALAGKSIVTASCGADFSVFVSDNGIALTCGEGRDGCLGHRDRQDAHRPRLVETLLSVDVAAIACGEKHVVALGTEGEVYAWGMGGDGQLGVSGSEEGFCEPQRVVITQSVRDVRCSHNATIFITDVGTLLACGNNLHNKLGLNERTGFLKLLNSNRAKKTEVEGRRVPTVVKSIKSVIDVRMGRHHTAVLTERDNVYILGSNKDGQMATGDNKHRASPYLVKDIKEYEALMIACGDTYTVVGTSSSHVLYWGTRFGPTVPPSPPLSDGLSSSDGAGGSGGATLLQLPDRHRRTRSSVSSSFSIKSLNSYQQDSESAIISRASSCQDIVGEESPDVPGTFYIPFPILNIQSSHDSSSDELAAFLDGLVPFRNNIFILVETNAPLWNAGDNRDGTRRKKPFQNRSSMHSLKVAGDDDEPLESSTDESLEDVTPLWLRRELDDASVIQQVQKTADSKKRTNNKASSRLNGEETVKPNTRSKATKSSPKASSSRLAIVEPAKVSRVSPERSLRAVRRSSRDHQSSSRVVAHTGLRKSPYHPHNANNNSTQLQAALQRLSREKDETEKRLAEERREHENHLMRIQEEHEREKTEQEQQMRAEIDALRHELNGVIRRIDNIPPRADHSTSRVCSLQ